MAESNNVKNLLGVSIDKIKEVVDTNTVIGDPIVSTNGTMVVPVSKVSYGFASGGTDLPSKHANSLFGGGAGAGINITPIAFLVISGSDVHLLPVSSKPDAFDKAISLIPGLVDKVSGLLNRKKDDDRVNEAKAQVEDGLNAQ